MSRRPHTEGSIPLRVLLVVAFLEVVINRVAIGSRTEPGLASALLVQGADPPTWHTLLSYAGLFLFYFTGTLAAVLVGMRCAAGLREARGVRDLVANIALAVAALVAVVPLVIAASPELSFPLELAFAIAVVAVVAAGFAHDRDLGVQLGLIAVAMPLLVHTVDVLGAHFLWPEGAFDRPGVTVARAGVMALCLAALLSPYAFAPRPFARAVTRLVPVSIAMTVAAAGAIAARAWYPLVAKAASLAIGVELNQGWADPRLALYLLSIATLAWTLASCALAGAEARRQIGAGIALVVLGGYGFRWPNHYLLPLLGLALIADAGRRVRDQELAQLPIAIETPAIGDAAWAAYIAAVTGALKRSVADVHALTTRAEGGLASSLIVGDKAGLAVRLRVERLEGSVIALDVTIGREIDEVRGATVCLWAIPPRHLGINPSGPPAAPVFKTGDNAFDDRFKARGNAIVLGRLLDDGLRARAVATLDGWLAYWEREGLRYRVYPGRGAPLDHPIPLSDLALGKAGNPERLASVIELLVEIAAHGVPAAPPQAQAEPELLDEEPTA